MLTVSIPPLAPIAEELNDDHLKVTVMAAQKYEIRGDFKKVVELAAEQLTFGANLVSGGLTDDSIEQQATVVNRKPRYQNDLKRDDEVL